MRRLIDLLRGTPALMKRGISRVNPRIAVLAVLVLIGCGVTWQAFAYLRRPKTAEAGAGPTVQIATGPAALQGAVQQAGAELSDQQLAGASLGLMSYGQDAPPPTSPPSPSTGNSYLPSSGDSLGGYGGESATSRRRSTSETEYGGYGGYSGGYGGTGGYGVSDDGAASPPADPNQATAADTPPPNPYRGGAAARLSDDEGDNAGGNGVAEQSVSDEATAGAKPPPSAVPGNPYAADSPPYTYGGAGSFGTAGGYGSEEPPTTQPPSSPPAASSAGVRPNALPPSLSASPYASAAQSAGQSTAASSELNPYQDSGSALGSGAASVLSSAAATPGKLAAPTPGERQLEGPQQPAVAIEKHAPAEIQIGKPATFTTVVRNTGRVPAHQVTVADHVPVGTQFVAARPQPQQAADGSLVWSIGTMQPGEESQIVVELMPQAEGEIGSTANVSFAAAATSRSICTRPQLTIEHAAPPKVLIGESLMVAVTVSNPGSGPATGVVIEEDVPAGLSHAAGSQLEYEIGTLRPGESKRLDLVLKAEQAGVVQNTIVVRGDAGLSAQHTVQIEVVAPQLQVAVDGPKRRFLERQATYTVQIANPGTAAARDVELVAFLPRGMRFVQTDSQGLYDSTRHAVFWSLSELPPAKAGAVKLTTLPVEPGEQKLRVESRASLGLTAASEQIVQVEQSAELLHTVKDLDDVIEVGSETTYEIRVRNVGTKAATQVRVTALLPAGMAAQSGEGPTRATGDAQQVVFEPLARLNPQEEVVFKVQAQGQEAGDHIVRVQLSSDEWPNPVTREESTRVYQDR